MRKTALFTAATVVGLVASQAAFASDDVLPSSDSTFRAWGEESGWNILVDEGRNSCLIERMRQNWGRRFTHGCRKAYNGAILFTLSRALPVQQNPKAVYLSIWHPPKIS